ncbi:AAA family ATPase [Candidatus Woesearchaeota archaeon]|nr:AAA family ATPase [Candidatus Woesearchaeota archaeon]
MEENTRPNQDENQASQSTDLTSDLASEPSQDQAPDQQQDQQAEPQEPNQEPSPEPNQEPVQEQQAPAPPPAPPETEEAEEEDDVPEPEWIKLYVPGFDEMIPSGIPKGSAVLLSGGPGTGKTTFSLQLLHEAAQKGGKCLYLTFEESVLRLKQHMKSYGWKPNILEKKGNLVIKKMEPFDISRSIEALLARASGELTIELEEVEGVIPKNFKPDIIVLDSLSAVAAAFGGREEGYRIYIDQLFSVFKESGATSFLISEIEQDANKYSKSGIEEFLADAVIVFYNIRNKNVRINALEILKIRGTVHQKKIVPFKIITQKGITVYPQEIAIT